MERKVLRVRQLMFAKNVTYVFGLGYAGAH